jgi:ubiquinone/menaquinone biosynthesis C-methylase UbiE
VLVSAIARGYRPSDLILDIGMGSGQVEESIFQRIPDARIVGVDSSQAMLDIAAERLRVYSDRYTAIRHDLREIDALEVPDTSYRWVISSQVLHEVPHSAQRAVFSFVASVLPQSGTFLYADRVTIDPDHFHDAYGAVWDGWKAKSPQLVGESFEEFFEQYRAKVDYTATLEQSISWLRDAGLRATPVHLQLNRFLIAAEPSG